MSHPTKTSANPKGLRRSAGKHGENGGTLSLDNRDKYLDVAKKWLQALTWILEHHIRPTWADTQAQRSKTPTLILKLRWGSLASRNQANTEDPLQKPFKVP
jgi:hypothetical protein